MNEFIERIYISELLAQCECAINSVKRLNKILEANDKSPKEFFREVGDLLQHSSAVSRFLWPPGSKDHQKKNRAKNRGVHLRKILKVTNDHILKNRTLRDHFEHFDERLDNWAETSHYKNIIDNFIGPQNAIGGETIKNQDIFRWYDPETKILIFHSEQFDIQALINGVIDIRLRANERLKQLDANHWLALTRSDPLSGGPEGRAGEVDGKTPKDPS